MKVPAFFLGAGLPGVLVLAVVLSAAFSTAFAIPTDEDPFPDPNQKPAKEVTPGEKVIAAAKQAMKDPEFPATPEAVEFALWCYAESGDVKDLERAESFLNRLPEGDSVHGEPSYLIRLQVARARGDDGSEMAFAGRPLASPHPMETMQVDLLRAVLSRDQALAEASLASVREAYERFRDTYRPLKNDSFESIPMPEDVLGLLQAGILASGLSGSGDLLDETVTLARKNKDWIFRHHPASREIRGDLLGERVLWTLGAMSGDGTLTAFAESALTVTLTERLPRAAKDAGLAPSAALAAARIEHHPVQMVLLGDPADPTLAALRLACAAMFEPRKILINLDPERDAKRIEELMYPAELAPALFVCVESICSAPITDPGKLESTVREIVAAARSLDP